MRHCGNRSADILSQVTFSASYNNSRTSGVGGMEALILLRAVRSRAGAREFLLPSIPCNCQRVCVMSSDRAETRGAWPAMPAAPALFLDIDGTLLDIAESPDRVVVPPSLASDLGRASAALGGALALISGRAIDSIDRLFAPLRLPAAGQHGLQLRYTADDPVLVAKRVDLGALRQLLAPLTGIAGVEIEDKGQSLAIHYRRARTDARQLRRWIAEALARVDAQQLE